MNFKYSKQWWFTMAFGTLVGVTMLHAMRVYGASDALRHVVGLLYGVVLAVGVTLLEEP